VFVEIALPIKHQGTFTYEISAKLKPQIGQRVLVPFRYRVQTGYIVDFPKSISFERSKLKKIEEVIDQQPIFSGKFFKFARWLSRYYFCPLGIVLKAMLPAGSKIETLQKISLLSQPNKTKTDDPHYKK